jgi:hypothetical protein
MGLAGAPKNSNPISRIFDGTDATYSPVANSDAITKQKSSGHLSLVIMSDFLQREFTLTAVLRGSRSVRQVSNPFALFSLNWIQVPVDRMVGLQISYKNAIRSEASPTAPL